MNDKQDRPDAVTEGNALCRAIAERDELRERLAKYEEIESWLAATPAGKSRSCGLTRYGDGAWNQSAEWSADFYEHDWNGKSVAHVTRGGAPGGTPELARERAWELFCEDISTSAETGVEA